MPRDQVSGDIYLAEETDDGFLICVIDCTGHGVPGAFLTMIASTALTRIIRDEELRDPSRILMRLNYTVKKTLRLDTEYSCSDDGMDAAVCAVHPDKNLLVFAGAKLPLIYIDNDEIRIVKGDRQSIGYKESKRSDIGFDFKTHEIRTEKGMSFYMATDGFADQLGGNNAEKFGNRRFRELLRTISKEPFDKRKDMLIRKFNEHKGNYERQDDVTVVGFSL
jgi:serine phosphatase RsbU (regulator of sigma subunit)